LRLKLSNELQLGIRESCHEVILMNSL
jgi:hypothetical protein